MGFRRNFSMQFYVGDYPTSTISSGNIVDNSGIGVTSITVQNAASVARIVISYSNGVLKYNYRAFAIMYANRTNTNDNDANAHIIWMYPVSHNATTGTGEV